MTLDALVRVRCVINFTLGINRALGAAVYSVNNEKCAFGGGQGGVIKRIERGSCEEDVRWV